MATKPKVMDNEDGIVLDHTFARGNRAMTARCVGGERTASWAPLTMVVLGGSRIEVGARHLDAVHVVVGPDTDGGEAFGQATAELG